jgi:hypothetical protein
MAPPDLKHLLSRPASITDYETQLRMHADIQSIWHTVWASRRSMEEARQALARADETLARRLSDRR